MNTEEYHSYEHTSYEIPPLTNNIESPIILSVQSFTLTSGKRYILKGSHKNNSARSGEAIIVLVIAVHTLIVMEETLICEGQNWKSSNLSKFYFKPQLSSHFT